MPDLAMLDYFYGDEAEQFTFYRIPKVLFTDPSYRRISSDAKILYGLMLDRMGLSVRNGWLDEYNRVFIFFTLEDALEYLCCGHTKAVSEMLRISMPEFEKLEYSVSEGYNCTAGGGSWMVLHYKNGFSSHKIQISGCTRICILSQAVTNADMLRNDIGYKRCEEMCHQ